MHFKSEKELRDNLVKGKITGIFNIRKNTSDIPAYIYSLSTTTASNDKWRQFLPVVNSIVNSLSDETYKNRPSFAVLILNPNGMWRSSANTRP
jgi:hypothetical protein